MAESWLGPTLEWPLVHLSDRPLLAEPGRTWCLRRGFPSHDGLTAIRQRWRDGYTHRSVVRALGGPGVFRIAAPSPPALLVGSLF